MIKIQKEKIYFLIILLASVILSTILWKIIHIPYFKNGIIGEYYLNNYNSLNDIIKYIIFILFPILTLLSWEFFYKKKSFSLIVSSLNSKEEFISYDKKLIALYIFINIFIILEFFSISFPEYKLDIFHSGQRLSSYFKNYSDGSLWSGSYVIIGIIHELLGTKLIWKIFDHESIGLIRFLDLIYILITKILLILLSYEITKSLQVKKNFKLLFFFINSLFFVNLIDYNLNSSDLIEFRDIPVLFILFFSFKIVNSHKNTNLYLSIIGLISVTSFFWGIDRAIVVNLLLLFIIFYFALINQYKYILTILASVFFFWLSFFFIFKNEFYFFLINTISIYSEINDIHGIIHPIPFSGEDNSARATKTLLIILFSLLISINLLFQNKNKYNNNFKIILLIISVTSFLSYIYALGRSDGGHIKQAFGYPFIFLIVYLLNFIIDFINRKSKISFEKNYFKIFFLLSIVLLLFNFKINISNIYNFNPNLNKYINLEDGHFLFNEDKEFVLKASKIFQNEKCIQLYTNDSAILYLLRKPSCSKYYFTWSIGSEKIQLELINDLKNIEILIAKGKTDNWGLSFEIKYPLLDKFIHKNFKTKLSIGSREIMYRSR